jgi:hypothetical protein
MRDLRTHVTSPNLNPGGRPTAFEERYRLYLDESGDHVFNHLEQPSHRYLCLLGCWFRNPEYLAFHERLAAFKREHVPHHPDDPPILHREDIINRRGHFTHLQNPDVAQAFDDALLTLLGETEFRVVGVVIDKLALREKYGEAAAHPYHLALGFLLQRYCGYLNHINRSGDVLAESRGGREDQLLMDSYARVYAQGIWMSPTIQFQRALTSKQLKVKRKITNIAGLQLADLLGHPLRQEILREEGLLPEGLAPFATRLLPVLDRKLNRHLYDGRVSGYGKVFYPK